MDDADAESDPSQAGPAEPEPGTGRHDEVDFAPADLSDGRAQDEWKTRYAERTAKVQIGLEALDLAALLSGGAFAILIVWQGVPRAWLAVSDTRYITFQVYAYAWLSGTLGGALFAIKWLYHSVGKGFWNQDRLLWRLFTPHLAGAFSFGLIALSTSGILEVLNRQLLRSAPADVGLGFLLGYFSDYTVARLYRTARHLLGGEGQTSRS